MRTTFIYGLYSSNNPNQIRYVGKANNPKERLRHHLFESKRGKTHKCCWIRSELEKGFNILYKILDECPYDKWPDYENKYINEYKNLTNTSKGGIGGSPYVYTLTYHELVEWNNKNLPKHINSGKKWMKYINEIDAQNIPITPFKVYKNSGWIDWPTFLNNGYKTKNNAIINNVTFDEFKKWLTNNNITNSVEFRKKKKEIDFPKNIPKRPDIFYKTKGWISWHDVLPICRIRKRIYWSYEECKMFIEQNYGPITRKYFRILIKEKKLPLEIPGKPERIFRNFKFSEFLNYIKYYTFEECIILVHSLKIKNNREWRNFMKNINQDKRIPSSPDSTYEGSFTNWYDWLGTKK